MIFVDIQAGGTMITIALVPKLVIPVRFLQEHMSLTETVLICKCKSMYVSPYQKGCLSDDAEDDIAVLVFLQGINVGHQTKLYWIGCAKLFVERVYSFISSFGQILDFSEI